MIRSFLWTLVLAVALVAQAAQAQSAADVAAARELFIEGAQLAREGKWVEARGRYERSLALKRAPMTLYRLGVAQMSSGALIVFAFFMISDPMTQPWHAGARALWVVATAGIGFWLQAEWIVTTGAPIWGLVLSAPMVPLLDRLFPAPRKEWVAPVHSQPKGVAA